MLISGIKTNDSDRKRPLQFAAALSYLRINQVFSFAALLDSTYMTAIRIINQVFSFAALLDSTYMTAIRITRPASRGRKTFLVRPATM